MIRRLTPHTLACLVGLALAGLVPATALAGAGPDTLSDSTWVDRWTLKNGLEVTVRHIPGAKAVAVIAAYRVGRDQDPKERSGLADLACEVLFTAATADEPERSREQMDGLRKMGWNLQVAPRFSLISEVASPQQFPGVLRLMASRMRGVTVSDSILEQARRIALREQAERYLGSPELTLLTQMRNLALGVSDEEQIRRLEGRALKDVSVREVADRLNRLYVPANAVLALAGNLEGVDLRGLVASLYENIPGGTAQPEPPPAQLVAAGRSLQRLDLTRAVGGVAVIAPAITDSLHPNFYLNSLVVGQFCEQAWGAAQAPLTFRFRYPVLADPELVQLFPAVAPEEKDPGQLGLAFQDAVEQLSESVVGLDTFEEMRTNHQWLFGGPLTGSLLKRMRTHPGTLHTLASTLAVRALWGDQAFWDRYLARFMNPRPTGSVKWADYFQSPSRIVRLLLVPVKR